MNLARHNQPIKNIVATTIVMQSKLVLIIGAYKKMLCYQGYQIAFIALILLLLNAAEIFSQQKALPLKVLTPNGGETFATGAPITVSWTGNRKKMVNVTVWDTVRLEYSTNNGVSWKLIADGITDTSYTWILPYLHSTQCLFRVTQTAGFIGAPDSVAAFEYSGRNRSIDFNSDGSRLFLLTTNEVKVWDMQTKQHIRSFPVLPYYISSFVVSKQGTKIALAYDPGPQQNYKCFISILDVETGQETMRIYSDSTGKGLPGDKIISVAFNPDGTKIFMGSWIQRPAEYDVATGKRLDTSSISGIYAAFYSDANTFIAYGYNNESAGIHIFDLTTNQLIRFIRGESLQFDCSDNGQLALVQPDDSPKLLSLVTGQQLQEWGGNRMYFSYKKDLSPSGALTALTLETVQFDRDLRRDSSIVVVENRLTIREFPRRTEIFRDSLGAFKITPDDKYVATALNNGQKGSVVLWSLDRNDRSDATFSITSPLPFPVPLTFDPIKVGATKDTTIALYLRNTLSTPLAITSANVAGPNADQFRLVAGGGAVVIPPQGSHAVQVQYSPDTVGIHQAAIEFQTDQGVIYGGLEGEARQGVISPSLATVDFGQVKVGLSDERVIRGVKNLGKASIRIDDLRITGQNVTKDWFTIVDAGTIPRELAINEEHELRLRFTPVTSSGAQGKLEWRDEYGRITTINLNGSGTTQTNVDAESNTVEQQEAIMVQVRPHPISDIMKLTYSLKNRGELMVDIVDMVGHQVWSGNYGVLEAGSGEIECNTEHIDPGVYILKIYSGEASQHQVIVIKR